MAQVEANGVTLDVEDNGDRSAPALLLIMGLGMPAALWPDGFVERLLASGLRVIRFDNRDCGHSTRLRSAVSTRNLPGAIARRCCACRCARPTRSTTWPTTPPRC